MKCEDARRFLGPYLDSELDPKTSFEVARHLEGCADCKTRFESEGSIERALATELARPGPTDDAIWERALHRARGSRGGRWRWAALVSGGLAAAAVLAWLLVLGEDGLASDLREDYEKHAHGGSPLELSSRNPLRELTLGYCSFPAPGSTANGIVRSCRRWRHTPPTSSQTS